MKTWYDSLFTKAIKTKAEYIHKIETLIFHEKSIQEPGKITLIFLQNKLLKIKSL